MKDVNVRHAVLEKIQARGQAEKSRELRHRFSMLASALAAYRIQLLSERSTLAAAAAQARCSSGVTRSRSVAVRVEPVFFFMPAMWHNCPTESKSMIRKSSGGYTVYARSGRKMGTYDTKAEANARKAQLEMFKAMRAPAFSPGHRGGRTQRSPRAQYVYIDTSDGKIYELIQKDRSSGGVTLQRIGLTATPPIYVPNARFQRVFVPRKASHTDIMLFRGPQHSWPGQRAQRSPTTEVRGKRVQLHPGTDQWMMGIATVRSPALTRTVRSRSRWIVLADRSACAAITLANGSESGALLCRTSPSATTQAT